jgi:hypothetical protein
MRYSSSRAALDRNSGGEISVSALPVSIAVATAIQQQPTVQL